MKLAQLRYFVAVVDTGSLSAAAKFLNISQPTISVTIKELEEELGIQLFNRDKNRLITTDAGTYFYSRVIDILRQLDECVLGTRQMSTQSKIITIGVPPMIGSFFTPLLLSEYNKKALPFELNIVEYSSDVLKNMLVNNLIDFAVLLSSYTDSTNSKPLFTEEYGFFVSPQNKLRDIDCITFDDIIDEPFIVFDRVLVRGNRGIAKKFKDSNAIPNIPLMTNQISAIKNYVRENVASTIIMKHCVNDFDGLVQVNLSDDLKNYADVCLCYNKGKILNDNEKKAELLIIDIANKIVNK